ncbi:unnamed protein product, partial [Mesorhabditis belari]|uniref:Inter-alpha-trypsin inhibitor heavy chain H4 n=1 Tax=Mesorhabditis belari TaxID=2138241 RepID=A0AAF3EX03_9BILA
MLFLQLLPLLGLVHSETVIRYLHALSEIQSCFASTDLVSEIENTGDVTEKVTFLVELPPNAFIRSFYLDRNGKITYGTIKEKAKVDDEFAVAESEKKTAVRLRESNSKIFELDVSLSARSHVSFNLTYQEILHKSSYVYKHAVLVRANLPIKDLQINVLIADKHNFSTIHVPEFAPGLNELPNAELLGKAVDPRVVLQAAGDLSGNLAYISYEANQVTQNGELILLFNTTVPPGETEIQVVDGFFLQQFTPSDEMQRGNKTVIFALDKSGSMKGRKIQQLKDSMQQILRELQPADHFNLILFDRESKLWKEEPMNASIENINEALEYINSIEAHGGTNIADALLKSYEMLADFEKKEKSFLPTIVFLTDGKATVGMRTSDEILEILPAEIDFPIQCIAFGRNADYGLLKQISANHHGFAKRIFENAESDVQIAGFYNELAVPLMKEIKVKYLDNQIDVGSVVNADESRMIFAGQELVTVGKLSPDKEDSSMNSIATQIEASVDEGTKVVSKEVTPSSMCVEESLLKQINASVINEIQMCGKTNTVGNFIERMWAQQTIVKYEKALESVAQSVEEKANVATRIKQLALQYGFVTSQTSMIVVLESEKRALRETAADGDDEEEDEDVDVTAGPMLQKADFGEEFRIPFDARKVQYPDECSFDLFIFVSETWSRQINRIRARRFGADLVSKIPPLAEPVPGRLASNGSLILENVGDETELFKRIRENPLHRHIVVVLAESIPQRTLQYLDSLRIGLTRLIVVSPFHTFTSDQKALIKSIRKTNVLESPKISELVDLLNC